MGWLRHTDCLLVVYVYSDTWLVCYCLRGLHLPHVVCHSHTHRLTYPPPLTSLSLSLSLCVGVCVCGGSGCFGSRFSSVLGD
mmetsp:Transcript_44627/g.126150  ORF Transcript_44627/g.126150 Transcript_44627/m.126150 type:complete len:82 (+) Transcript_44627:399-644(+)